MRAMKGMKFMEYHERMKKVRTENGLTQKQIAELMNMSQSGYSKYETGKIILSANVLIKFCNATRVSTDYILGLSDDLKYYENY